MVAETELRLVAARRVFLSRMRCILGTRKGELVYWAQRLVRSEVSFLPGASITAVASRRLGVGRAC